MPTFVAIDFETADAGRDSACAVGLVRVEDGRVVARDHRLIRPPRTTFQFTHVHGITWDDMRIGLLPVAPIPGASAAI